MITMLRIVIPTNKLLSVIREKLFALDIIAKNLNTKFKVHIQFNHSLNLRNFRITYENLDITFDQTRPVVITAEENLLIALRNSVNFDGWTWVLGDDDYFNFELVQKILEACKQSSLGETYSVISLNNNLFNEDKSPVFSDSRITNKNNVISVQNFILLNGLISSSAGFSNWILYLTPKDIVEFEEILDRKIKIYWHLPWILSIAFKLNAIRRIESPKLQYTLNAHDKDGSSNWTNYAEKVDISIHSPWGENLIDLIFSICIDGFFKQTEIKFITERDGYGYKYNLGEFITNKALIEILFYLDNSEIDKARALSGKLIMFAYRSNLFPGGILSELFKLVDVETLEKHHFKKRIETFLQLISRYKTEFGAFNYTWMVHWSNKSIVFDFSGCAIVVHRKCCLEIKHEDFISFYNQNLSEETLFAPLCFCDQENSTNLTNNVNILNSVRGSKIYKMYKIFPASIRKQIRKAVGLT
jgi:hypothetical protein